MRPATHQLGLTLIEVLIAVVVLAIGLLGVAGLQAGGIYNNFVAHQYSQAAQHAQSITERMRANRPGMLANRYTLPAGTAPAAPPVDCTADTCTPEELAAWDLWQWYGPIFGVEGFGAERVLPNPEVAIRCVDNPCTNFSPRHVAVCWDPDRQTGEDVERTCLSVAVAP